MDNTTATKHPVCQCEDITHFDDGAPERLEQRYQAHGYGTEQETAKPISTDFGTFVVCRECVDRNHMGTKYIEDFMAVNS